MKPIGALVTLFIAGVAGFMGYLWFSGGDCSGGREFTSVDACDRAGERPRDCRDWFAEANRLLSRRGPFHMDQNRCIAAHDTCQPADVATGWTPRATGFCVMGQGSVTVVPRFVGRSG